MLKSRLFSLAALLVLAVAGRTAPPAEAIKLLEDYQKESEEARKKFQEQERQSRVKLVEALDKILKRFIDAGMLEEAVAVKEEIAKLRADVANVRVNVKPQPFPGSVPSGAENVGKSFVYEVTG